MALRLRIISDHRRVLGERASVLFGTAGGTIGRSADNDWVLPDPHRYVSAHHARIRYQDGHYLIEDTSTNGVFINEDERPLAKIGPHRLKHGDLLRVGDYQVVVALDARAASDAVPTQIEVLHSVGRAAQTDLGAALNLDDLLMGDSPSGSRLRPVDAYGQAVAFAAPAVAAEAVPARAPQDEEAAIARRIERLARAAARARDARNEKLPALYDVQNGLQAFCRGAGIDAERLPGDSQTRLMHLIGQLMREALLGLKDLARTRHELRNRFRIELDEDPNDPRPQLERSSIEDLLIQVLTQHESRRLDAVQWLREALGSTQQHEQALIEALRVAFLDFVGRLDPSELTARFQRAPRRGKLGVSAESQYWGLFVEFYRNLTEMPADQLPHTFVEAFANAYRSVLAAPGEPEA